MRTVASSWTGSRPVLQLDADRARRARPAADLRDLADVDPGDPHRRAAAQAGCGLDDDVEPVAVHERQVLREGEPGPDEQDERAGDAEADGLAGEPAVLRGAAAHPHRPPSRSFVLAVRTGWRPAGLPMRCPGSHGSLPVSHSVSSLRGAGTAWRFGDGRACW